MYKLSIVLNSGFIISATTLSAPIVQTHDKGKIFIGWEASEPKAELYLQFVRDADISAVLIESDETPTKPGDVAIGVDDERMVFTKQNIMDINAAGDSRAGAIREIRTATNCSFHRAMYVLQCLVNSGVVNKSFDNGLVVPNNIKRIY